MAMRELAENPTDRRFHVARCALRGESREHVSIIKAYMGKGASQRDLLSKALEVYAELLGFGDSGGNVRLIVNDEVCMWRVPK